MASVTAVEAGGCANAYAEALVCSAWVPAMAGWRWAAPGRCGPAVDARFRDGALPLDTSRDVAATVPGATTVGLTPPSGSTIAWAWRYVTGIVGWVDVDAAFDEGLAHGEAVVVPALEAAGLRRREGTPPAEDAGGAEEEAPLPRVLCAVL